MNKKLWANLLLFSVALIWGFGFVAMDQAAELLEPFTFNAFRMGLGGLSLLPVVWWRSLSGQTPRWRQLDSASKKDHLLGGFLCGVMVVFGAGLQQIGISMGTEAGKAGFIAALYIIFVPLLGIFWRKIPGRLMWLAVAFSTAGLYFLCIQGGFSLAAADGFIIVSAMFYAGHILVVDRFGPRTDCLKMSLIQFITAAAMFTALAVCTEQISFANVLSGAWQLLYVGVAGSGLAFTLQILGQRHASPTASSLILSMESVFAVIAGWLLLGDALSGRELLGCALMMAGIILAQLPQKSKTLSCTSSPKVIP